MTTLSGREFNLLHGGETFILVTTLADTDVGFQYKIGLNVDTNSENCLYFSEINKTVFTYKYGLENYKYFRQVDIPDGAAVLTAGDGYVANQIILSERKEIWNDNRLCIAAVEQNPLVLKSVVNQTYEICKIAILKDPHVLKDVRDQTDELCLAAIAGDPEAIHDVKDKIIGYHPRAEELWTKAINKDPWLIKHICGCDRVPWVVYPEISATYEMYEIAMSKAGRTLFFVKSIDKEQYVKLCEIALAQDGSALEYVQDIKTMAMPIREKLYTIAVRQNYSEIKNIVPIPDLTVKFINEIVRLAFFQNVDIYSYIKNTEWAHVLSTALLEEIWTSLVEKDGNQLKNAPFKTEKMSLAAVRQNGNSLCHVALQTDEICELAVSNSGLALEYVKTQTEKICRIALSQNRNAAQYIQIKY
ncbi:MAG: hypothetical protein Harvfovirus5_8 [Harvfovirus sp.]|uniref:DUF4116 domain-containing protein n=1 Tax=Harvfovirus sp. TaxID=2487768 RepID=A0A3G5A2H6_9VIRU|nr:MAG: hypothetical protein Harvfovirus5_8 [Harvfovirus sp.]